MNPIEAWFILAFALSFQPGAGSWWLYQSPTITASGKAYSSEPECWQAAKDAKGLKIRGIDTVGVVCVRGYVLTLPEDAK